MSYCAVDTTAPSISREPIKPEPFVAPPTLIDQVPPLSDKYCGVSQNVTLEPGSAVLTFVAVDDVVLVQKNNVKTFNVKDVNGSSASSTADHVMQLGADGSSATIPVKDFVILSDTANSVPASQGVITKGSEPGEYTFSPATDFVGDVTPWTYTATDRGVDGVTDDTATVRIRVIDQPVDICRGLQWQGVWTAGKEYNDGMTGTCVNRDVIKLDDNSGMFVCIRSHVANALNKPVHSGFDGPSEWGEYWEKMIEDTGSGPSTPQPEESMTESLINGVFDWMKNATIGDWAKAILVGAGIAWAGSKIVDMMSDDGGDSAGDNADSRYNGTPTYSGVYTPPSLRSVVQSLCIEAGISNFDVSALSNTVTCHFSLSQQTSVRTLLDNLSRSFQFDMVDSAGVLKFVPRNTNIVRTLTHEDMGFNSTGDVVAPVTLKRLQSVDLPRSVSLTYMAEDLDYNNFTQRAEIATFDAGNDINLQVPFMLTHADAKEATDQLLIGAHLERMQYTFKTSYKDAIDLEPSDVIQIPEGIVRIVQIEEIDEGVLEIHCVDAGVTGAPQPVTDSSGTIIGYTASTHVGTGLAAQLPSAVLNAAHTVSRAGVIWFDPPTLDSADRLPRIYAAVHGFGVKGWPGADVYVSKDGGATYSTIASTTTPATIGLVASPTPHRSPQLFDNTTVIRVQLKSGTLVSKPDEALLAGENLCMIGQECISFGVATLVAPNTYDLSHLLRGRKCSEWATTSHQPNELFVLLDDAPVEISLTEADRGKQFSFKVVTHGSDLSKVDAEHVQLIGENTIPFTPGLVRIDDVGADFKITWKERPRFGGGELRDYIDGVHDDDFGGYAVIIFNGTEAVRQTIVYEPSFVYTYAMQISDFGTQQFSCKASVSQISTKFGGSRPVTVNI